MGRWIYCYSTLASCTPQRRDGRKGGCGTGKSSSGLLGVGVDGTSSSSHERSGPRRPPPRPPPLPPRDIFRNDVVANINSKVTTSFQKRLSCATELVDPSTVLVQKTGGRISGGQGLIFHRLQDWSIRHSPASCPYTRYSRTGGISPDRQYPQ